ncbi:MBL fold metallo-hydrolase [Herminiimonas contaminans]|uniref:MBL fold metallo-hydrolase n=1 Tax=Herminiimonas contaminans TaxID=1111140 RepID=A0ABS0EWP2_9BURK|nr:MBL fold metallo-hydrolase [Herminiimonas contaminans]MBF8179259.1 MBL fold metallo-hydrolase [Herminiimonas contaminans]
MAYEVKSFFDPVSSTFSYVLHSGHGSVCAVLDSVLDFDIKWGRTSTKSADEIIEFVKENSLEVEWLLETHAHADHISAARYLKSKLGGKIAVGSGIREVQKTFGEIYNLEEAGKDRFGYFDHLFEADEAFVIGNIKVSAWHVPGHTPADTAYVIDGKAVFVGDTLFMPDVGTARCDFPGGNAEILYRSIRRILAMPPSTYLYVCHDYPPNGREPAYITNVDDQNNNNLHIRAGISKNAFVALRDARDIILSPPVLMLPAVQINIRAGELPTAESNGVRYLRIPLDVL